MDIVHELDMADHRKYNKIALNEFFNPTRFGLINDASKFMKSAPKVIALAPLVHGFTSEPKYKKYVIEYSIKIRYKITKLYSLGTIR